MWSIHANKKEKLALAEGFNGNLRCGKIKDILDSYIICLLQKILKNTERGPTLY